MLSRKGYNFCCTDYPVEMEGIYIFSDFFFFFFLCFSFVVNFEVRVGDVRTQQSFIDPVKRSGRLAKKSFF